MNGKQITNKFNPSHPTLTPPPHPTPHSHFHPTPLTDTSTPTLTIMGISQNLQTFRICCERFLNFSKLTSPSTRDSLPSNRKVRSFLMMGNSGMKGGCVARCSSLYFAMLWKGFMNPVRSCVCTVCVKKTFPDPSV